MSGYKESDIPNNKLIGDGKADIVGDITIGLGGLLQKKTGHSYGGRLESFELVEQLDHRVASVDDILDDQEILSGIS